MHLQLSQRVYGPAADSDVEIEITPEMVSRMRDHATFEVYIPNVRVSKKSAETIISLHLMNSNSSPDKTPISGFPRYLMMEESVKSKP